MNEYNQCQSQLRLLKEQGIPIRNDEFTAYRMLYSLFRNNIHELQATMASLSPEHPQSLEVKHAIDVVKVCITGNYHAFFVLYRNAPHMGGYLMVCMHCTALISFSLDLSLMSMNGFYHVVVLILTLTLTSHYNYNSRISWSTGKDKKLWQSYLKLTRVGLVLAGLLMNWVLMTWNMLRRLSSLMAGYCLKMGRLISLPLEEL